MGKHLKIGVAETSRECYHTITAQGQIKREIDLVLSIITKEQPVTSRQLSSLSGKERGNITRSLFNLVQEGKVKIHYTDKCPVTGKRVSFYTLSTWEEVANAS